MCATITASTVGELERSREAAWAASAKLFPLALRKSDSSSASRRVASVLVVRLTVLGSTH